MSHRFFKQAPPGVEPGKLNGILIVIEGMDASGRTTQIERLATWLEEKGYAVVQVGLKRSELVGQDLEKAKQGNVLSPRTMALFYATDFYDQMENTIIPALRAGSVVLADRYIFTLMARDLVRGGDQHWLETLYSMALMPSAIFYLNASWRSLVNRTLQAHAALDYWESGMDLGLSRDWYESYIKYQRKLGAEFKRLEKQYHFTAVDANRSIGAVNRELRRHIEEVLKRDYPASRVEGGHPPSA
jgi:dTMP kinase